MSFLKNPAVTDALIVGSVVGAFTCLFNWRVSLEQAMVLIGLTALNFLIIHWPEASRRP